jgi:hypothetical protein
VKPTERRIALPELPAARFQPVDHNSIDTLVGDEQAFARRIERDVMCVRTGLRWAWTRSSVLDVVGGWSNPAIGVNREHGYAAIFVIRDDDEGPGPIHAQVARLAASSWLAIDRLQVSGSRVNTEGRDGTIVRSEALARREEEPT